MEQIVSIHQQDGRHAMQKALELCRVKLRKKDWIAILTEPFMVGFVNYAIDLRMMQSPMHPIDSIIREQKKARRKIGTLINRQEGRTYNGIEAKR